MKFVVSLAFSPPAHLVALARAADELGFEAVALSDHVVHPREIRTPYPYTPDGKPRWEPFTDWPDPWVTVGALAAATERLRFFTSVYVLPMRNVFTVAKQVATAAVLSEDRVALGIGVGWMKDEFELLGQDFHTRGKRTDEMIEVLRKLWGGGWVEHHGAHIDFDALEMSPAPQREIPIWCGGFSDPALRRAALRCDGWISDLHSTAELAEFVGKLGALRADGPRHDKPLSVLAAANDAFDLDGYRKLTDAGVTHTLTMPWMFYGAGPDDLEAKLDGLRQFADDVLRPLDD